MSMITKPSFPLRVVAILMTLGDLGHTTGVLYSIPRNLEQGGLLAPLQAFHVVKMGTTRTHWDFYAGFGLSVTFQFLLIAGLAWLAGTLADEDPVRARPFIYLLLAAQLAGVVIGFVYFFAAPVVVTLLTLICIVWSLFLIGSRNPGGADARSAAGLDAA